MNKPKHSRGAVLIEFTIIFPLLLLMVLGITELGRALYQKNTLTKAVEVGARYMARVNAEGDIIDRSTCVVKATGTYPATWSARLGDAEQLVLDTAQPVLPGLVAADVSFGLDQGLAVSGDEECLVRVSADTGFNPILGPLTLPIINVTFDLTQVRIHAKSEEQYIGE